MAFNYLEDNKGNKSSTRFEALLIIIYAMAMTGFIIVGGSLLIDELKSGDVIALAGSGGAFFTLITGSVMIYKYKQKRTEEGK